MVLIVRRNLSYSNFLLNNTIRIINPLHNCCNLSSIKLSRTPNIITYSYKNNKIRCLVQRNLSECFVNKHVNKISASYCKGFLKYDVQKNSAVCFSNSSKGTESKQQNEEKENIITNPEGEKKVSLFQKMKQMTKDYWHIVIPVHIVTSTVWISVFYVAAKNGIDIVRILESLNLSEKYLEMLRGSSAGNWAIAYALYKLATPLRYTVTIGGSTMVIRHLMKYGYIKLKKRSKSSKGSSAT